MHTNTSDKINPPIIALATELCGFLFSGSIAKGRMARTVVALVIMIALNFCAHASIMVFTLIVSSVLQFSYRIIALFTDVPNSDVNAMTVFMFIDERESMRDVNAPKNAGGREASIINGMRKLSN